MAIFPKFNVEVIDESGRRLAGSIDRQSQGSEKWIDDQFVGALFQAPIVAFGRWCSVGDLWQFQFDEGEEAKLSVAVGDSVDVIDSYWGERVELVLDQNINWAKANYKSNSSSDHSHCLICWATISESENVAHYVSGKYTHVCPACYESYVSTKSISFVPGV